MMPPTPHTLPTGWVECKLADIGILTTGNTPPTNDSKNYGDDIPFIQPPDLKNCKIFNSSKKITEYARNKTRILSPYSILVSCIGNLGRVGINTREIGFNQQINAITPYESIDSFYCFYFMQQHTVKNQLEELSSATTVAIVNKTSFSKINFSFPPLNEQRRIVAKIEALFSELENGVVQLTLTQAKLKQYRQALLKTAFNGNLTADWRAKQNSPHVERSETSPHLSREILRSAQDNEGGLPVGWEEKSLGECGNTHGGGTPSKSNNEYWDNGTILWVTPKDMKHNLIKTSIVKITEQGLQNSSAKLTSNRAILFVIRSGILRRILPIAMVDMPVTVNQDLMVLNIKNNICTNYLFWYCQANEKDIRNQCAKDGTTVESVDASKLKQFPVPLPPLHEQAEIVKRLEAQFSVIDAIEAEITLNLQKAETLKQAILQKAFTGQLVPQDPTDEPASELLKRIQSEKTTQATLSKKSRSSRLNQKATTTV